jgi:cell division protein FtsI/penicillin-binding protein 2
MVEQHFRKGRIWFLYFLFGAIACTFIGQLYFLQIVRGQEFRDKAEGQYKISSDPFDRNSIYFTEKDGTTVSAATLKSGFILTVNPQKITSIEEAYKKLNAIIPIDKKYFLAKSAKKDDPYEEVAHRLPEETAQKIKDMKIAGVSMYREHWRYYPGENSAAHILGFVGYKDDGVTLAGRYGLERYYDDVLNKDNGKPGRNFFAEVFSSAQNVIDPSLKSKGDIVLTIEPTVQELLEKKLQETKTKYNSGVTGGIIMNPKTGEIYAMAAVPNFNPNDISQEKNVSVFNNPIVESVYEMGSIVKPLAMAAAIDTGEVTAQTTYNDTAGSVVVDGKKISNYDGKGRGRNIPMQKVLDDSLNTGMVFVMKKMGREKFSKYMLSYDMSEETGIDLPGEVPGLMENLRSPRDVEHATAAFGQGIAMTPIEITKALASLGNGGLLVNPHLLKKTVYATGIEKVYTPEEGTRVLKPETSEKISRMLVSVVDNALLGGTVKLPNYSIAAKTGTAQISRGDGHGYYDDRYLHSFFGYFPAYDPKFIIFLYTYYPVGEKYASHTLTAPFMDLAKFLLTYYEVPPDR